MNLVHSPALRPSHPHVCRKRVFGQGHVLSGRFAGLDQMPLLSGYGCLRATDEEASGGGFVKGSSQFRDAKTATRKSISRLSRLFLIPTRDGHDTCKPAPAYAPQSSPHTCAVTARHALGCPHRHAHHANHVVSWIQIGRFPHDAQVFAAYRFHVSRMFTRYRRHAYQQPTGYNSASRPIRTRHIPDGRIMSPRFRTDACSFVRHSLRRPAYVSYRRSASYCTAGEGRCPFEPRKAQRQGTR